MNYEDESIPAALRNKIKGLIPYSNTRGKLLSLFKKTPIVPIALIPSLLDYKIDFKKVKCFKSHSSHKTATDFLHCCSDAFSIVKGSQLYLFYKELDMQSKTMSRVRNHITNNDFPQNSLYFHFEVMIVNIFSFKTTILLADLEILFKKIYKRDLASLGKYKEKIIEMNSPNLFIKKIPGKADRLVLVPTYDKEYKLWGDEEIHKIVVEMEDFTEKKNLKERNLSSFVFDNQNIEGLVKIANLNTPKNLICKIPSPSEIFEKCNDEDGLDDSYFYVISSFFVRR